MKLASFEIISEILPIEGADRIELARIQGWQSVIQKNQYKVGDEIIFVPIDTVLKPEEWNTFLWDKNDPSKDIRIRTKRLKNVISQGVIFPKSLIDLEDLLKHSETESEDQYISRKLGISKYEKHIPPHLAGKIIGEFPTYILSKTDEDNLLSNISAFEELKNSEEIICTLKCDGTSGTFIKEYDGSFRVCSRNKELGDSSENVHWVVAKKYSLSEIIPNGYALQGEIAGPGIQKNPMGLNEVKLFTFNFLNISTREYIQLEENNIFNLHTVSVIRKWNNHEFLNLTLDDLQKFCNTLKYSNGKPAEGIVLRGYKNGKLMYSNTLQKMLSVKIINQNYID